METYVCSPSIRLKNESSCLQREPKDMTKTEQGYQQSDSANEQVIMMSIPTQTMSRNSKKGIKKNRNVDEIIAKRQTKKKTYLGKILLKPCSPPQLSMGSVPLKENLQNPLHNEKSTSPLPSSCPPFSLISVSL